jgi:hypothetical protein
VRKWAGKSFAHGTSLAMPTGVWLRNVAQQLHKWRNRFVLGAEFEKVGLFVFGQSLLKIFFPSLIQLFDFLPPV